MTTEEILELLTQRAKNASIVAMSLDSNDTRTYDNAELWGTIVLIINDIADYIRRNSNKEEQ